MKTTVIHLPSVAPISSAALVAAPQRRQPQTHSDQTTPQNRQIQQALLALHQAAEQMQQSSLRLFASHREQLIRLSIEIAAKILAKDTQEQNYQIEDILRQALEGIPCDRPITVRLNPQDLQTCQQTVEKNDTAQLALLRMIPDPSVRPAECIIETEDGIIEWIVQEHLKRISDALLAGVQPHDENTNENQLP